MTGNGDWCHGGIAVDSEVKAIALEKYFKSHSGRVFATKHF